MVTTNKCHQKMSSEYDKEIKACNYKNINETKRKTTREEKGGEKMHDRNKTTKSQ